MNITMEYVPFLVPIILIEAALLIAALLHIFKHNKYRFGNRIMWIIIVAAIQIVGPIIYFTIGRGED